MNTTHGRKERHNNLRPNNMRFFALTCGPRTAYSTAAMRYWVEITTVCWIVASLAVWAAEAAPAGEHPATARLLADVSTAAPGRAFRVGVLFTMAPSWHIYWKNPGDSGMPTMIRFAGPAGTEFSSLHWPAPSAFSDGEMTTYGYEGSVLLWATATLPQNTPVGGTVEISAECQWLVCRRECLSGGAKLALSLRVGDVPVPADADVFARWAGSLPVAAASPECPVELSVTRQAAGDRQRGASFRIAGRWKGRAGRDVAACPDSGEAFKVEGIRVERLADGFIILLNAEVLKGKEQDGSELPVVVSFTDEAGVRRGVNVALPMRPGH